MARITSSPAADNLRLPQGWRVKAFDELDGTNAALRRMVEMGAEDSEGLIITAKSQSAGRGRDGRAWTSPPGNLYASFLVPASGGVMRASEIGFVAALAVIGAIQTLVPDNAPDEALRCKWPNDVLFEGAKVSGILLETVNAPEGGKLYVIVGIGLNLVPVDVDQARYPVTSLAQHGTRVGTGTALEALAKHFAIWMDTWLRDGFAPVREGWLKSAAGLGQTISVRLPQETISGTFIDIDANGALVIDTIVGRRTIHAGDVILPRSE
ncbi:MAG: biotin--[acetyl-CoA-carboxylase] ligase [Rhodospirillaceae bacterium]|nr:biotin--[acetyl-CoA-carboxylase] ligase [Rhodospirillaceae bacterium]